MTDDLAFRLTCPDCGGALAPFGYTSAGHRRAICTACTTESIITIIPPTKLTHPVNRNAPFYGLVLLVDEACNQPARPGRKDAA